MTLEVKKPKFLVLLAAFNGSKWIAEQVDSILSQKDVDVTILISVDLSSDGTEELVTRLAAKDARVNVLAFGDSFGGAASNFYRLIRDADFARYDFMALADQDDIWMDSKLKRACHIINTSKVDAYSSNVIAFWPDGRKSLIRKNQKQTKWDFIFEAAGPGCTYVINRRMAIDLKSFVIRNWLTVNELGLHDWFIYAYARANQYLWFIDDKPSILYRQHSSNQVGVNQGWKAFKYRFHKIISGWGFEQALLISKVIGVSSNRFFESWSSLSKVGILKLSFQSNVCRRRLRDKVLFFFSCWIFAFFGSR